MLPERSDKPLVLSLFPGIGLLDRAFELEGFQIVRGPDLLWGGDVRHFHAKRGCFDGVIGGPPCQAHSAAGEILGSAQEDLIPEFLRIATEAEPSFVVMENVMQAVGHPQIPKDWHHAVIRDWDCGGHTNRRRAFWTWPMMLMEPGGRAGGDPSYSVLASSWKRGRSDNSYHKEKNFLPGDLSIKEYARLQGAEYLGEMLVRMRCSRAYAVHMLGNGVPVAMGRFVARSVMASLLRLTKQ
jgi:DNA (cytosine-5)-methyltransferase 1